VNDYVCDKAACYKADTDKTDYYADCCDGHYENSQLLDGVSGQRHQYYGPTNGEVLSATDPRKETYSMPYIYDKFDWSHCTYDFDALLQSMSDGTFVSQGNTGGDAKGMPTGEKANENIEKSSTKPGSEADSASTATETKRTRQRGSTGSRKFAGSRKAKI